MGLNLGRSVRPPARRPFTRWGSGVFCRESLATGIVAEDHFIPSRRLDPKGIPYQIFAKRIYRPAEKGEIIINWPGAWSNGNIFRGAVLRLEQGEVCDFRDTDSLCSFANQAAARGFEFWIIHGWLPRVWNRYVARYYGNTRRVPLGDISFENTLEKDVPAVLDYIQGVTSKGRFGVSGHSMGGLLWYAYAGLTQDPRIAAIETIASGVSFTEEQKTILLMALVSFMYLTLGFKEWQPLQMVSQFVLPLSRLVPDDPTNLVGFPLFWNPENISQRMAQYAVQKVSEPLPLQEFYFLVQMVLTRKFQSLPQNGHTDLNWAQIVSDFLKYRGPRWLPALPFYRRGQTNYFKTMQKVRCPVLVAYGGKDRLTPPGAVVKALEAVSSEKKVTHFEPEAGHVDILLGRTAPRLWEASLDFMDENIR